MYSCSDNCTGPALPAMLQAYPEFARTTFDQAPPGFSSACSELAKKHGKVTQHTAPSQELLRLLQPRARRQLHSVWAASCADSGKGVQDLVCFPQHGLHAVAAPRRATSVQLPLPAGSRSTLHPSVHLDGPPRGRSCEPQADHVVSKAAQSDVRVLSMLQAVCSALHS